ncbi:hypothetical protein V3C99_015108 [Haemonchus contortus]
MKSFYPAFFAVFTFMAHPLLSQSATSTTPAEDISKDGNLEANDTEITILINSSFVIIEDLEIYNITDSSNAAEKTNVKRTKIQKSGPPSCRKFSISEKYKMLEGIGGRNQLYMAETPDEASRGFVQPSLSFMPKAKSFSDTVDQNDNSPFCNEECQVIKKTLEDALEKRRRTKPLARAPADLGILFKDTGPMEVDEGRTKNNGRCALETFVPLGNCTEPGDEVSWAHEQLCSMCRGIYMLSDNCFPTFFNSVLCNQRETGCIFDNFSDKAHGICRPETLALRVLRNRGDPECEDWAVEQIELPVACQCLLSKGSWLRSQPPKEL